MADPVSDANGAAGLHPNCDTMKHHGLLLLAIALMAFMLSACEEGESIRIAQPTDVQPSPSATTTPLTGNDVSNPSPEDHYFFWRPIPSGQVNWPHPFYRYGSSYFGESDIHTGVDLGADRGAPVLAAGPGEVVWAGYGLYRGIEDLTDPYGLAVAIRHDFGYQGQELYTVYAHMQKVFVWDGQHVEAGEQIGTVGSTGHSDGPHLHFEVRLGENRFFSTRNPELWMVPPEGWAVLAGRITDTYGNLLPEFPLKIRSLETGKKWEVWTYVLTTIHPDDYYDENFVISDLPAGPYEITIDFAGFQYVAYLTLYAGETNFIIFRGRNGFVVHPTPTPVDLSSPPDL
ncbi:MAG: peptidoglycan DD-metalloendopeptidase family protein [Anaerolineales bacterium]